MYIDDRENVVDTSNIRKDFFKVQEKCVDQYNAILQKITKELDEYFYRFKIFSLGEKYR
jgi:hypothetical protein